MYLDSFCVLEFSTPVLHVLTLGITSPITIHSVNAP